MQRIGASDEQRVGSQRPATLVSSCLLNHVLAVDPEPQLGGKPRPWREDRDLKPIEHDVTLGQPLTDATKDRVRSRQVNLGTAANYRWEPAANSQAARFKAANCNWWSQWIAGSKRSER